MDGVGSRFQGARRTFAVLHRGGVAVHRRGHGGRRAIGHPRGVLLDSVGGHFHEASSRSAVVDGDSPRGHVGHLSRRAAADVVFQVGRASEARQG